MTARQHRKHQRRICGTDSSMSSLLSTSSASSCSSWSCEPASLTTRPQHDSGTTAVSRRIRPPPEQSTTGRDYEEEEEEPLTITLFPPPLPSASASSVNTYDSRLSDDAAGPDVGIADEPSGLPPYRAGPADPLLRPADPYTFGRLFPSLDRLAIRHDDAVADGNMSLRVETAAVQLFHLHMRHLARRDFSLRRYGRDSNREVCQCKRAYAAPSPAAGPAIPRSVSAALRSVTTPFRRSAISHDAAPSRPSSPAGIPRPSTCGSTVTADTASSSASSAAARLVQTDTIKLEFGNYACVHVRRRGSKRYELEWWGRHYAWRRVVDKTLGTVSFHLARDGRGHPVAHIVPEVRSPIQVEADARAGGWIPLSYMWISDPSVVETMTDVGDVIVATGLVALVDDCIRDRWQAKKPAPLLPCQPHIGSGPARPERPKTGIRRIFSRRPSTQHSHSPLRFGRTVAVC